MLSGKFTSYDDMVSRMTGASTTQSRDDCVQTLAEMLDCDEYRNLFGPHDYDNLYKLNAVTTITRKALVGYACAVKFAKEKKGEWVELIAPEFRTVPIPAVDKDDKFVIMKDKPVPVRKDPPVYEDIAFGMTLFTRDKVCADQEAMDWTAKRLGKHRSLLTPNDFPCDYYYPGFLEKPAEGSAVSAKSESAVSAMISVYSESTRKKFVSIWAEGGTAYMRYASAGATHIDVVVPAGYDFSAHVATYNFCLRSFPDVTVKVHQDRPSAYDLQTMSSDDFITRFSLDPDSYFLSTYLPQFSHLKDGFADYCIIGMDSTSSIGLPRVSLPPLCESKVLSERFLLIWLTEQFPEKLRKGRFSCFDPGKNIIVSYAEHGVFIDYIFDPTTAGTRDYSTFDLSLFSPRKHVKTKLKVIRKSLVGARDSTGNFAHLGVATVAPSNSIDVTPLRTLSGCGYLPSWETFTVTSTRDGTISFMGVEFVDLPICRDIVFASTPEGPKIIDVLYGRKNYSQRLASVPVDYVYEAVPYVLWDYAFVVFPSSLMPVTSFWVDRGRLFDMLKTPRKSIVTEEFKVCGIGWNWKLKRLVYDRSAFFSWSPFSLKSIELDYRNNAWFAEDDALWHAYFFKGSGVTGVIDGSPSEDCLSFDDVEILFQILPDSVKHASQELSFFASLYQLEK